MSANTELLAAITGSKTIRLVRRNVFGNEIVYPDCERSRLFARAIGNKTLSGMQVEILRDLFIPLGVAVNVTESSK